MSCCHVNVVCSEVCSVCLLRIISFRTMNSANICQTCLSRDRTLYPFHRIEDLLKELQFWEIAKGSAVCWECYSMMKKFTKFRRRAIEAQNVMKVGTIDGLNSLSTLTRETKYFFDYQYYYDSDPLINTEESKHELKIKDENDINDHECNDSENVYSNDVRLSDNDDRNDSFDIYVHSIDIKKSKKRCKKVDSIFDPNESKDIVDDDISVIKKRVRTKSKKENIDVVEAKKDRHKKRDRNKNVDSDKSLEVNKSNRSENKNDDNDYEAYDEDLDSDDKKRDDVDSDAENENVRDKFSMVVFTEEEMMKNREEKRNHTNFKKIPYKCDMCVLGFMKKESLDVHMEKKHDKSVGHLECDVCHIRFTTESAVERHRSKHFICYRCKICKYETVEVYAVANHCRAKHKGDKIDEIHCQQCDMIAKNPEDLAEHIKTQHMVYCNECGEKFKAKNTLRRHKRRIHAVKREFICDICTKTFINKTRLESHMVTHNTTIAQRLSYCTICKIQYKNIYVYRSHLKNSANHSERAYPCPECDKKFASKVYWTKHYNFYHLQKSQFSCEICNKLFISDWRLKNHKQKHHGLSRSRDHSCNICGKKFYSLTTLRNHQLTHSDQRTYMCEDCGDTFKQRPALYTHSRLVHRGFKKRK